MTMSINVSGKQLAQPDFISLIKNILEETRLNPRCLILELTESYLIENAETVSFKLVELKQLDVQIHIDDFGTGYSSLSYLNSFPVNALKIDRSFINRIGNNGENAEIVQAIVDLARNLKMDVIAEGVEMEQHLGILKALKCRYVQGYYFSQPLNYLEVEDLLLEVNANLSKIKSL